MTLHYTKMGWSRLERVKMGQITLHFNRLD